MAAQLVLRGYAKTCNSAEEASVQDVALALSHESGSLASSIRDGFCPKTTTVVATEICVGRLQIGDTFDAWETAARHP